MDPEEGKTSIKLKDRRKPMYIETYNIRIIRTEEQIEELESEINSLNWDVIGLSETGLPGDMSPSLKSGQV